MRARKSVQEASALTKFRLLMWKNFMQQWRHPIQTVVEILLPVATICLVLILRWQIEPVTRGPMAYPAFRAHSLNFSALVLAGFNLSEISIAYSPENEVIDDVIRSAVINIFIENIKDIIPIILDQLPEIDLPPIVIPPDIIDFNTTLIYDFIKNFVRVYPYSSSADLRGVYYDEDITRKIICAVEFADELKDATQLPTNISYALRFPERPRLNSFFLQGGRSWRTDIVFPFFELPGPRFPFSWEGGNDPGYVNEMFIALQQGISMEIISRITGNVFRNMTVNLQRYPHPVYVEDFAIDALQLLFAMFIMLSFSYTAVNIVRAITVEKELQLKETMKIMGLPIWLHWTAWFCKQFLYLLFTAVFIVIILKINWFTNEQGFSEYAVFTNTPWSVLLFFLCLYLACTIFFCFMISGFFSQGNTAALFAGVIWFLTAVPGFLLGMDIEISAAVQVFICFSINTAMSYGFQLMLAKESTNGMQWGEFFETNSLDSTRLVFGHVVVMLAVNCVLYMLIALYLEQVMPGPFGAPKPWYFLFQKEFWFPSKDTIDNHVIANDIDDVVKEQDPRGHATGVKISNLTKIYGKNIAVNNLNLNIYDDQITVLLGHNGAGKSTTISMLTGNVEVTHGNVWVAGYDISTQTHEARAHLGLCPQHNVLFNDLTVQEHLEFFSRLKGYSGQELYDEIDMLIENLEMQEKRNYRSSGLSGGQKRRLCVGIALSGGARVVLLDEPTSGMDPASRRALWDLLQKEKKGRSMILTTHFMDEADYLGDRVAIMSSGRLQCVGSPYFLKQHFGVGYTLVIVKSQGFQYHACTDLINKYIPGTVIKDDRGTEVTYSLTNEHSHIFEAMLSDLEQNINTINFKNYGLVATTLEDVFMSVGSDVELHSESDDTATVTTDESVDDVLKNDLEATSFNLNRSENVKGIKLIYQHVIAVWLKLWLVLSRSWGLLLLQVLVPILQINTNLGILEYLLSRVAQVVSRSLTLTGGYISTETLLSYNGTSDSSLGALAKTGYELSISSLNEASAAVTIVDEPIDDYYMNRTSDPIIMGVLRNRLLMGATFSDNSVTAWFSNFGYHDVATSLATVHDALLKAVMPDAEIKVYNHPLEVNYRDQSDLQLRVSLLSMQVSNSIGNSLGIVSAVFIMFYIRERVSRAKLLQKAAGIQPSVMWGAAAVFDWLWFLIICIGIVISCAAFQVIGLSTFKELGRMYLCFMIYGAAMLPLHYLFSLVFNGPAMGFVVLFFINVLFGMLGPQVVEALGAGLTTQHVADILDNILQFFPLYSLVTSVRSLNTIGLTEYTCLQACEYLQSIMPNTTECNLEFLCDNFSTTCCVRDDPFFEWESPGILRYMICMLVSLIVFWSIFMILEYNLIQKLVYRERRPPPLAAGELDEDVRAEAEHARRAPSALSTQSLVAQDLSKYYGKHLAVDQVSFTVSDGECFGLLGVNGAGKTTTFKMLMGDEIISSGDAFVSGYSVRNDITKVHENIGYCPQFDAVFPELTGRETLRMFSLLRGLPSEGFGTRAEILAHALGFIKHLDKRVHQYSGGNKRKLSTAVALLGRTRLVFVDEPTTGVDPAAKRQVWRAIRAATRARRAVVLTSHSMEECEALCSRLTIMVNGRFQCLGTPQHLKNKFSQGFTLTIKMNVNQERNSMLGTIKTRAVKDYVRENFTNPKLMEEYQGLITYYLPDCSVPWSKMFGIMERAKRQLDVEDYSISQTTLEQIFLQFTKYQRDGQMNN